MKNFYIYAHIKIEDGEIFYIGKGCGNRAGKTTKRSSFWNNIVNKYEYDILLIEEHLSNEEALIREQYYIKLFGRRDLGLGTLVNHTDGGEGCINISEEHRNKLSISSSGTNNPFYGKKHSEEALDKIRLARSKQILTEETRNKYKLRKPSEETRLKMSLSKIGKKPKQSSIDKMLETRRLNKLKTKLQ